MWSCVETVSSQKLGFLVANELLASSPKPLKAKNFKFLEKQNTNYSNFISHPNIFHNMPYNLHHYAKNKLSEWAY